MPTFEIESRGGYRDVEESSEEEDESATGSLRIEIQESDADQAEPAQEQRHRPPRPSSLQRSSLRPQSTAQRRRRSSGHFLSLGAERARELSRKSLALIYKEEIKMNAENRINSANSWDLKMIDNLEKFLTVDEDEEEGRAEGTSLGTSPQNCAVNFTKASCSLDASVKIYGHRVDNVYLTSYKVLANLNRSHSNKKQKDTISNEADGGGVVEDRPTRKKPVGPTLESNLSNINVNKLDSAFDIDPLFHKMSKKFDEGGAKGLLLVNLGTGDNNCNIVFDTSSHENEMESERSQTEDDPNQVYIDCSCLQRKLEEILDGQSTDSFPLVHQLAGLRVDFSDLEEEGFVDTEAPEAGVQRYAPEAESEEEADRSIHREALERSRQSEGLLVRTQDIDSPADGFVGGDDDDFGGYDDDDGFDDFIGVGDDGERLSSMSVAGSIQQETSQQRQQTTAILDAIASGKLLGKSDYEYLDRNALSQIQQNAWAGAAHWRPTQHGSKSKSKKAHVQQPENEKKSRKGAKQRKFVNLGISPDMTDTLRMPPKLRGRNNSNPLQFTKAVVEKHTSADHLLPFDAGISVEVFTSLFLRSKSGLKEQISTSDQPRVEKTVAFDLGEAEAYGADWGNDSYGGGDDDDGEGFTFADSGVEEGGPEFVGAGFDAIRRIEKIQVGYATVAKKVDVKRLKQDLWIEIDSRIDDGNNEQSTDMGKMSSEGTPLQTPSKSNLHLSFYDTVQDMEHNKKQADVSLPFYFICMLHLANEKGLRLESQGLNDFLISKDFEEEEA